MDSFLTFLNGLWISDTNSTALQANVEIVGPLTREQRQLVLRRLAALTLLDLGGCYELTFVPESLGSLAALTLLDLSRCDALKVLPESLGNLAALATLKYVCLCCHNSTAAVAGPAHSTRDAQFVRLLCTGETT